MAGPAVSEALDGDCIVSRRYLSTEPAPATTGRELRVKGVLVRYGIRQTDLAKAVVQPNGHAISKAAMALLVGHGKWPVLTSRADIEAAVTAYLRQAGVPEAELAGLFEPETEKDYLWARPVRQKQQAAQEANTIESIGEPEMLYPETKKHFNLFRDPFKDDVQGAQDVYLSADQRYIREAMYSTAKHGGFMAVIGESGSGKTTLFNDLHERIAADRAKVVVATPSVVDVDLDSSKTRLTARRILEALLSVVSSERPRQSMQRLTDQVRAALAQTTASESGHSVVLMVEEAHSLLPATLKTIKRLLELKAGHRYLLGVILIGQPELSDLLDESRHPELREVIRRCEVATLMPLDAHLEAYVAHKFQRRNVDPSGVFAPDALEAIRARLTMRHGRAVASQLYPLMVNNLVVKAMNHAARIGEDRVTADVIRAL